MKIVCKQCQTVYNIAEKRLPEKNKVATCKKCRGKIMVPAKKLNPEPIPTTLNCYSYHGDEVIPSVINYRFNKNLSIRAQDEKRRFSLQLSFITGVLTGWLLGLLFLTVVIAFQS